MFDSCKYHHLLLNFDWICPLPFRFQVKKKQFFRNFMTIMLFGAVGTLISFFIITLGTLKKLIFVTMNRIIAQKGNALILPILYKICLLMFSFPVRCNVHFREIWYRFTRNRVSRLSWYAPF